MKHLISTALVVILLLSLGALAVLARGGGDILSPAKARCRFARCRARGAGRYECAGCRAGSCGGDHWMECHRLAAGHEQFGHDGKSSEGTYSVLLPYRHTVSQWGSQNLQVGCGQSEVGHLVWDDDPAGLSGLSWTSAPDRDQRGHIYCLDRHLGQRAPAVPGNRLHKVWGFAWPASAGPYRLELHHDSAGQDRTDDGRCPDVGHGFDGQSN